MLEFKSANLNTGNVLKITEGDTSSVSYGIYYYKYQSLEERLYENVQNIMVIFYDLHQDPRIIFVNGEYNFVLT